MVLSPWLATVLMMMGMGESGVENSKEAISSGANVENSTETIDPERMCVVLTGYEPDRFSREETDKKFSQLWADKQRNVEQYTKLHGYRLLSKRWPHSSLAFGPKDALNNKSGIHVQSHYAKLRFLSEALENGSLDECEYAFLSDIDTLVTEMRLPLERVFKLRKGIDLHISQDAHSQVFNSGQMLVRLHEPWLRSWLARDAWEPNEANEAEACGRGKNSRANTHSCIRWKLYATSSDQMYWKSRFDQFGDPVRCAGHPRCVDAHDGTSLRCFTEDDVKGHCHACLHEHIAQYHPKRFNAYPESTGRCTKENWRGCFTLWTPGDFLIHFAGVPASRAAKLWPFALKEAKQSLEAAHKLKKVGAYWRLNVLPPVPSCTQVVSATSTGKKILNYWGISRL